MKKKCIALFSGGLDSMISMQLMADQGIEVTALHIDMGFGAKKSKKELLEKRAKIVGAKFRVADIKDQFIKEILFAPKYGYGKNLNPCIDCHGNMLRVAHKVMIEEGADFIITGEVIGQRPKSQKRDAMEIVGQLGLGEDKNIVLRPMSAKIMDITLPEEKGWVDREKLLGVSGRNREVQLRLAQEYDFEDFESPGGGCLLTDVGFTHKIKESIKFNKFDSAELAVLKVGRHLRLPDGAKFVLGKDKDDNELISQIQSNKYEFVTLQDISGPLGLISANASLDDKTLAVKTILTYTKANLNQNYDVKIGDTLYSDTKFEDRAQTREYFINI